MQEDQQDTQNVHKHIVSSAGYIALGTLSSRILGLIRDALLGAFFSRTVTDAWLVAFRVPNLFRRLFGEGALSISFIPVLVQLMTNPQSKKNGEDVRLVAGVLSILALCLGTITVLGILFSEHIIFWIAGQSAYLSVPGKFDLTVKMAKIMFGFCFFICMYAYFAAILNAFKNFVWAAFAPVFFNIAMIVSTLLPALWPALFSIHWLAWGVLIGGLLQMLVVVYALFKEKIFLKLTLAWNDENIALVFRKMLPGILGLGVMQMALIINTHFAASLEEGANSWIYWSDRVLELPLSLFAVSLGTALLPTFSAHWAKQEKKQMSELANSYLRMIFVVALPCAVGLWCLSRPIVEVLFLRGKFNLHDLENTSLVLSVYASGILFFAGIRVVLPAFYAAQNTLFPALVAVMSLTVHYFLAQILMSKYGVGGLAASSMITTALNFLLLLIGFCKWIGVIF